MKTFKYYRLGIIFVSIFLITFASCKDDKNNDETPITPTTNPTTKQPTKEQIWATELFSAMKQIYLWNDALPATLDTAKYATTSTALEYLIGIKMNLQTGKTIDRYSFLDKIGNLSGEISGGTASGDYGFSIKAAYNSSKQVAFYVSYVYKNSPAGIAGVTRSYEITKVNGIADVHPEVSGNYLVTTSAGYINVINAIFSSSTASFTFKKPDGNSLDVSLKAASYTINSVLCDSIYTLGTKKVGYIVFNQFLGETAQAELSKVITKFETNGVQNLIVDLRYNGGGSVATCEYLCNLLAPLSANGQTMYSYKMNSLLTQYYESKNESLTTTFKKINSFQPTKIYFIVSGGTASASELLINNLRPYYSGKLFLIGTTTYGKPCGFWATPIGYTSDQKTTKEGYDLYAVSFETVNAANAGGYYAGMTPGTTEYPGVLANDFFNLPWGNINDDCLNKAFNHINNGTFVSVSNSPAKMKSFSIQSVSGLDRQFKGMIDFRKHLQ